MGRCPYGISSSLAAWRKGSYDTNKFPPAFAKKIVKLSSIFSGDNMFSEYVKNS